MQTQHILTQMLNQTTGAKGLVLGADANTSGNFKQMLQKEVQNQNKAAPSADASKTKPKNIEKPNQAPPPQQNKTVSESNGKSNDTEKLNNDKAETETQESESTDETVLALIDQLGQVNQITQIQVPTEIRPEGNSELTKEISVDDALIPLANGKKAAKIELKSSDAENIQNIAPRSDMSSPENVGGAEVGITISNENESQQTALSTETRSFVEVAKAALQQTSTAGRAQPELQKPSRNDTAITKLDRTQNSELEHVLESQSQIETINASKSIESSPPLSTAPRRQDDKEVVDIGIGKPAKDVEFKDLSLSKFVSEKTSFAAAQNETRIKNVDATLESNSAIQATTSAPPSASENLKLAELKQANAVSDHIAPRVGSKAWDQAIGQKVVWMVAGGDQSAELSLNPPDLGPVQVVLSVSDNQVDASFISSHLEVREAIEAAAPRLREMMDNAGISLSGFSVSSQASQSSPQYQESNGPKQVTRQLSSVDDGKVTHTIDKSAQRRPTLGAVDTFV